MGAQLFKASLRQERGKLKQKFASLTDDDFLLEEGRNEEREGRYQALLFQTEEELNRIVTSL